MRNQILLLAGAALALGLAHGADASTLYGATYTGNTSDLYTFDQATGAATFIGATGQNIGDMTNIGQSLVGIDLTNNALWTLNAATGAASGEVDISGTRGTITSIAWDPVTKVLYGNTTDSFSGSDVLYTIDAVTGVATLVGDLGATNMFALGFSQTGALFGAAGSGFFGINTATGAASLVGPTGFTTFDLASRPEDNVLFGSPGDDSLLTFNTATGAGSAVGPFGASLNIAGLAFLGGGVPEPATWAMMITGLGLAGASLRARRRAFAGAAA